jgi:hypothetical protein
MLIAQIGLVNMDTGETVYEHVPIDKRNVIAIEYVSGGDIKHIFAYTSDIISEAVSYTSLIIPMRKDFKHIGDDELKKKFVYNRFGLNAPDEDGDTLEEQLDQEDLKDAWITYSSSRDEKDGIFADIVKMIYGTTDGYEEEGPKEGFGDLPLNSGYMHNYVTVTGDFFSFEYQTIGDMTSEGGYYYVIRYDNGDYECDRTDDEGLAMPLYIIPIEFLSSLPMYQKFDAYNKLFSIWVFSQKTVKVKWYQTLFFRMIMLLIPVGFAFMTFGASAAMNVAMMNVGLQVAGQILSSLDPRILSILGVVAGIYLGSFTVTNFNGIVNIVNNMLKVVQSFHTVAFKNQLERITEEIDTLRDEQKDMEDELKDMTTRGIYIPIGDTLEYGYNDLYELAYNAPNLLAVSVDPEFYVTKYY